MVACVTCRSSFFSWRKWRTTSVTPRLVRPGHALTVNFGRTLLVKPDDLARCSLPLLTATLERFELQRGRAARDVLSR
jgi:hypothetical protein